MGQQIEPDLKPKVFVLMPFDPEFDDIFGKLIKPALEEVGYDVTRADSLLNQQNILKDVVRGIAEADLVIVDLTSLNANVFYELGISHTLGKPTVLLSQSNDDIPFDLKAYRVITYSIHFRDAPRLKQNLKDIGERAKSGELGFGNPVTDFLPQLNGEIPSSALKGPVLPSQNVKISIEKKDVVTDEDEKGIWDFIVESEKSLSDITKCIDRISNATHEIGQSFKIGTEEAVRIHKEGGGRPGTAARIHKCASDMATNLNLYAQTLEEQQPILHNNWDTFGENTFGFIRFARFFSKEDKEGAIKYRSNLEKMQSAIRSSLHGMREYQKTTANLRGISKEINRASKRTTRILDLLIADMEGADSFCVKTITLLNEKIEFECKDF